MLKIGMTLVLAAILFLGGCALKREPHSSNQIPISSIGSWYGRASGQRTSNDWNDRRDGVNGNEKTVDDFT